MLAIRDSIRTLISGRASAGEIKAAAIENGMVTLRQDGLRKVAQGKTTLDEIKQATQTDL